MVRCTWDRIDRPGRRADRPPNSGPRRRPSISSHRCTQIGEQPIFGGKPGRGKTHLAVAIAYRAIQNGFDARFVTAAELIDELSAAFRSGRLADALATYIHPGVLVVDEVGYLTYGTDAANMLFHVVNDRHRKKRAMIFTTNKPLSAWGRVLHDEDLAHAIVDRILERGRVLTLDGPSMWTKHLGLDDPTASEALHQPASTPDREVIRISGIEVPEFPEPTTVSFFSIEAAVHCQNRRRLCTLDTWRLNGWTT